MDVPVLHHGMLGTNLFSDIEVLIVLNAHYYNPYAIIAGVKTQFGIELNLRCFKKRQATFKTLAEEYTVSRWGYFDQEQPDNTEGDGVIVQRRNYPLILERDEGHANGIIRGKHN